MARLKDYYKQDVAPALMKKFSYKSVMQIPKLDKIVINVGAGEAKDNAKVIDAITTDLAAITGQKPVVCKARKSVANFKLREGMNIGVKVTLRGDRMYEFLDRLFNVALPRVRDFRGINPNSFDGRGNYNMGIKEQLIDPADLRRQSYTGRIPGKRAKTDKGHFSGNADRLYQPEPCRRPPDDRLASGERSKRYDGFGQ